MARGTSGKTGTSKVRLVVFEAEVSDGDLSQFTQAIQNALLPRNAGTVRVIASASKALANESEPEIEEEDGEIVDQDSTIVSKSRPPRAPRSRAIRAPKVVNGVDWDAQPSLKSFSGEFSLKTMFERYLVVALWFKEHRDTPSVTSSHIYTAFRHLSWPVSIADFDKPFRNMRDNQLFTGGTKEGFVINQLGEGKIRGKQRAPTE